MAHLAEANKLYYDLAARAIPKKRWDCVLASVKRFGQVSDAYYTTEGRLIIMLDLGALEGRKARMAKDLLTSRIVDKLDAEKPIKATLGLLV